MALHALGLCLFATFAYAASNDSIVNIQLPDPIVAGNFLTFDYLFEGDVGHVLRNITAELMVGKAEDNGTDVTDIICDHVADTDPVLSFDFFYQAHAATPPGNYHIRMNGTSYNTLQAGPGEPGTPVSNLTFRSKTFAITSGPPFPCTTPAFTPVRSISDPGYSPLRLGQPNGGDTYFQTNLSSVGITVAPYWVDDSFAGHKVPSMSLELVSSTSGASAGVQQVTDPTLAYQYLTMSNFKVSPGAWKVRANFTSDVHAGNFVSLSDEFYIASQTPCVGLVAGNSTSPSSPSSSSSSSGSSKPSRALCSFSTSMSTLLVVIVAGLVSLVFA
ncbi:hypothetical protein B0H10DRAFT_1976913 [Mycena sp. CBHHK59/15]|nr:hypothetical protein B0H10DRAFT_1976913 [Mycena sp. CBHHK59/15]